MFHLVQFLGHERDKERFAAAEHIRLIKITKGQQSSHWGGLRTLARWLGQHMVGWGEKLRDVGSAPLPEATSAVTEV